MCEQIRQYTIGILSMDARYLTPDEVIAVLLGLHILIQFSSKSFFRKILIQGDFGLRFIRI